MPWYRAQLEPDAGGEGLVAAIREHLRLLCTEEPYPPGVALFRAVPGTGSPTLYFSPNAAELAAMAIRRLEALPCDPPDAARVTLLYGAPDAADQLLRPGQSLASGTGAGSARVSVSDGHQCAKVLNEYLDDLHEGTLRPCEHYLSRCPPASRQQCADAMTGMDCSAAFGLLDEFCLRSPHPEKK